MEYGCWLDDTWGTYNLERIAEILDAYNPLPHGATRREYVKAQRHLAENGNPNDETTMAAESDITWQLWDEYLDALNRLTTRGTWEYRDGGLWLEDDAMRCLECDAYIPTNHGKTWEESDALCPACLPHL